jgi:hypothetical protein
MVIEPTVFVIGDDDDRDLPVGSVAYYVDDLRYEQLAALNIVGRMVIVLIGAEKSRIDERYVR